MIKNTILFSEQTGEVVKEERRQFSDSLNDDGYRMPSHKLGYRIFSEVSFPEGMSDSDIGKMCRLAKLMIPKNNMLGYRDRNKIHPYLVEEIGVLIGLNKRCSKEFVWKMINLGVMCREDAKDETRYFINPAYFMANGQRLSLDMFIRFQKELIPILPKWVINEFLRQAGAKKYEDNIRNNFKSAINQENKRR